MMAEHLLGSYSVASDFTTGSSAQDTEISFAEQALNTLNVRYQLNDHERATHPNFRAMHPDCQPSVRRY